MHEKWLISHDCQHAMANLIAAGRMPTVEQQREFRATADDRRKSRGGGPENYEVIDGVAHIGITGLLTAEPDFWAWLLGEENTTYSDIDEAVALAEGDPKVKSIRYHVASPGGTVDGLEQARNAIDQSKKPRDVYASQAASGGYWLGVRAARGGRFIATSPMASFGSIGVAVTMPDLSARGYVAIASTDAPNKRPDVTTSEGIKVVQGELDEIHDMFANDVATARGVSREKVNIDFGRGGTMLAERALSAGMIDAIQPRPEPARVKASVEDSTPPVEAGETHDGKPVVQPPQPGLNEGKKMDADKLKSEHPDLFAKVQKMGFDAGVEAGVASERDRVSAHLTLADGSGDTEYALKCVKDGTPALNANVTATHMASAMKRASLQARAEDGKEADKATAGATPKEAPEAKGSKEMTEDELAFAMDKTFGTKGGE
ncbi:MAG: S49 family peptidase [Nitrospira sp.]|nr:S49 family peptidase [Nitrospira sp.]